MTQAVLSTNTFTASTWIVNSNATKGTHTTLAAALTAASSGDTILLQTSVTENPTFKAGVNIVGYAGADLNPAVSITGKCTFTTAGSVTLQNINLITNSDYAIAVTGSAASVLNLRNCYLNCSNNTGINYSSSSASSAITLYNCNGNLGTTGIGYFTASGAGPLMFENGSYTNTGGSTTASTTSATVVTLSYVQFGGVLSTSSTGGYNFLHTFIEPTTYGLNATCVTLAGTGASTALNCEFWSGSASAISIGTGTSIRFSGVCDIFSSNTNAITGLGTFTGCATFSGSSSLNNATTKTQTNMAVGGLSFDYGSTVMSNYAIGTWTPTMVGGSVAGSTSYGVQVGYYVRVGAIVQLQCVVTCSAATGTGAVTMGALPFTVKNQSSGTAYGTANINNAMTFPVGTTTMIVQAAANGNTAIFAGYGTATNATALQMANAALNNQFTLVHEI